MHENTNRLTVLELTTVSKSKHSLFTNNNEKKLHKYRMASQENLDITPTQPPNIAG